MRKNENVGKKNVGLHNGAISGLHIGAGFRNYRSRQEGVQIGTALEFSSCGKKITNRGWDFKLRQGDFKSAQRL